MVEAYKPHIMPLQDHCPGAQKGLKKIHSLSQISNPLLLNGDKFLMFIANELIEKYKRTERRGVIIKLDIEKAFEMVDWDFLDDILRAKGFGHKWR